jgi:hypothetical protein
MEKIQPQEIRDAKVKLAGLVPGRYRIEWWNTQSGKIDREEVRTHAAGALEFTAPPFARDVACKVLRSD